METKKWFLVRAICGHVGTHRYKERSVFIYGEDVNDVLFIYGRLPSVKKNIRGYPFPTIRPIGDSEVGNLEGLIVQRRETNSRTLLMAPLSPIAFGLDKEYITQIGEDKKY